MRRPIVLLLACSLVSVSTPIAPISIKSDNLFLSQAISPRSTFFPKFWNHFKHGPQFLTAQIMPIVLLFAQAQMQAARYIFMTPAESKTVVQGMPSTQEFSDIEKNAIKRALCLLRIYSEASDGPKELRTLMEPGTFPNLYFLKGKTDAFVSHFFPNAPRQIGLDLEAMNFALVKDHFLIVFDPNYSGNALEIVAHEIGGHIAYRESQSRIEREQAAFHHSLASLFWIYFHATDDEVKPFLTPQDLIDLPCQIIPHEILMLQMSGSSLTALESRQYDLIKTQVRNSKSSPAINALSRGA